LPVVCPGIVFAPMPFSPALEAPSNTNAHQPGTLASAGRRRQVAKGKDPNFTFFFLCKSSSRYAERIVGLGDNDSHYRLAKDDSLALPMLWA
jgi:hypothetical protein